MVEYLLKCTILFLFAGGIWYELDRIIGTKVYRGWYRLTHQHPLPSGEDYGLIFRRPVHQKFLMAGLISAAQSVYMVWHFGVDPLTEIIAGILEVPIMVIGFIMVGPLLGRLWDKRESVFETFNRFEQGTASPFTWFEGIFRSLTNTVVRLTTSRKPVEKPVKEKETPKPAPEPFDWRKSIDNYTKPKRGRS